MKRGAIWLVAMLAAGSVSCNGGKDAEIARLKSKLEASKKTVAAKPTDDGPKVWLDENEDTRRVLQLVGYEKAFVIRWQHGELEGWIELTSRGWTLACRSRAVPRGYLSTENKSGILRK
jgi:hypothetical protein